MAVTRKPQEPRTADPAPADEAAFHAYVDQGGSVPSEKPPPMEKPTIFTLRLPVALCTQLDQLRDARPVKSSRHQWVLEAIAEKISREHAENS